MTSPAMDGVSLAPINGLINGVMGLSSRENAGCLKRHFFFYKMSRPANF